jgi:ribonuclease G
MNIVRKIIANAIDPEETRVAIVEEGRLAEMFVERMWERQRTGEIYKARVDSVLPGMHSAFLNLGDGRNAFLYLADARGITVKPNGELLVQVVKSARKGKGARVTPRISLPGRYLVLVPGGHEVGVSRRILDEDERKRLRRVARALRPDEMGIIVRTVAEGMDDEALRRDLEELLVFWQEIEYNAKKQSAPCLLYRDLGLLGRVLRDELTEEVSEIVVDCEEEAERVRSYVTRFSAGTVPEVNVYRGATPIFEFFGIERELEAALDRKIWLPSGAYLIVEQTEALTVIDVNTGKFTGKTDLRSTVLETNLEAAEEIARLLRLRAVGGIVVIDFIDMEHEEDRQTLLDRLHEVFQHDRYRAKVFGVTQLGLVEITRKRARPDLRSTFTRGCPFCGGSGWVLKEDSVAMSLKRFLRKVICSSKSEAMVVELHPVVARYVAETYLASWEEEFERRLFLVENPDAAWEKYRMETQGALEQVERKLSLLAGREVPPIVHRTTSA